MIQQNSFRSQTKAQQFCTVSLLHFQREAGVANAYCVSFQLGFEDLIAEPASTHSFDRVWICSHALFELSKYLIYKLLTFLLAIPLALIAGILFAVLSCLHIW